MIGFALSSLALVGCAGVGKPPWWPKPKPVEAARCTEPTDDYSGARELQVIAEIDMDDGHVQRTTMVDPRNPQHTPWNPELARLGECYSDAKDLEPEAKGAVVVGYTAEAGGGVSNMCLVRTAIRDGALIDCVMRGVRSLPSPWLDASAASGVVSVDFIPETEAGYSYWYGPNEMRWWGTQPPPTVDGHQDATDFSGGPPLSR